MAFFNVQNVNEYRGGRVSETTGTIFMNVSQKI
jgi:hypothetical protein